MCDLLKPGGGLVQFHSNGPVFYPYLTKVHDTKGNFISLPPRMFISALRQFLAGGLDRIADSVTNINSV